MTLGQMLRGCTIQGNVWLSVWDGIMNEQPTDEELFEYLDSSHPVIEWAKEHKVLSKRVHWVFANDGFLHIEVWMNE